MTQPLDLLVRGGTVYSSGGHARADVAIRDETIVAIGPAEPAPPARRVIEADGLAILPGIWHTHCHFREPGHTHKEDFATGTLAAAAGGVTFCLDQTNNSPHPTSLESFLAKRELVASKAHVVMDHGTIVAEPGFGRFTPGPAVS